MFGMRERIQNDALTDWNSMKYSILFCRGVDGVLTDYLEKFVPWIHYPWYLLTIAGLAGLIYFNYNDVGVCEAIKMVWSL